MKLFLPSSALVSGYGVDSRHHVPRSTVSGGQVGASSSAVLPSSRLAFLALPTVGIAAAGNLPLRPSVSRAPAWGLELTGCPAIIATTAWRAASARPVVENTSASRATSIAGEGSHPLTAPLRSCRGRRAAEG